MRPKGRGRLPVVPGQPRWRLTSGLALTLWPPLRFQAPPMCIPVPLTSGRVCLTASALSVGSFTSAEDSRTIINNILPPRALIGDKIQPPEDGGRPLNAPCPGVLLLYVSEAKKYQLPHLPMKASHMFPFNPSFQRPSDTERSPGTRSAQKQGRGADVIVQGEGRCARQHR